MAEVNGRIVGGLLGRGGPEIEGVSGAAALEAVEDVVEQLDGEATAGAGVGAVQRTATALLSTENRLGLEAEQLQD